MHKGLAQQLIAYANNPLSITIEGFANSKALSPAKFQKLIADDTDLADAYDLALSIIGERRELLAIQGKLDKQLYLSTLNTYNRNQATGEVSGPPKVIMVPEFQPRETMSAETTTHEY